MSEAVPIVAGKPADRSLAIAYPAPGTYVAGASSSFARNAALALLPILATLPLAALVLRIGPGQVVEAFGRLFSEGRGLPALAFGLKQAAGSSLVALLVGLPGAWIFATWRFPGRSLARALALLPFCLPPVLVALGFVQYYGRNGIVNQVLSGFGLPGFGAIGFLYSLPGLCLVHGFYNFPLVLDLVGSALSGIAPTRSEAARSLGAGRLRAFFAGTLPGILPSILEAAALSFLFSFFSFVVVMLFAPLGSATTETEIWRLYRLEGDPAGATALALVQTFLALMILGLLAFGASRLSAPSSEGVAGRESRKPGPIGWIAIAGYGFTLAVLFFGPLLMVLFGSLTDRQAFGAASFPAIGSWLRVLGSGLLARALVDTLVSALPAALIATACGFVLANLWKGNRMRADSLASLPLAISGVVAAAGWSLLLPTAGLWAVILVEALIALPFSLKTSLHALSLLKEEGAEAARSLGASPLQALLRIRLPAILPSLLSSLAFSFALAAGDATTPLVLGVPDFEPLPLAIYRLAGAYRFPEACVLGVVLALLSGFAFRAKGWTFFHA